MALTDGNIVSTIQSPRALALPRLGQINYINSLPVVLPLTMGLVKIEADIQYGTPNELNQRYRDSMLELGAMSAFFYLTRDDLQLIPGLSISSRGPVGSVLFFCKSTLETIQAPCIQVPKASATSINLLKILLKENMGIAPALQAVDNPNLDDDTADGALVIGDRALLVDQDWRSQYKRFDLGEWWYDRFHLPMVFGLWAARQSWQKENPHLFLALTESLVCAAKVGLTDAFLQVLQEAQQRTGLSSRRLQHYYLNELDFSWSPDHVLGLKRYEHLCQVHNLL